MDEKEKTAPEFQVSDRRFWVRDDSAVDRATEPAKRYPTYVEELKARTELAEQKLREKIDQLDRENEAFRARYSKEAERRAERELFEILRGFLEVIDNLERALKAAVDNPDPQTLEEGVRLSLQLFLSKLKTAGIERIDLAGETFDPRLAEAVGTKPVAEAERDQTVCEVVQQGYRWREQLLRPARVVVGQHHPPADDPAPEIENPEGEVSD